MEDHSKDEVLGVCNRLYCIHPAHFKKGNRHPAGPKSCSHRTGRATSVCVCEPPALSQLQTRPVYRSNSVKRCDSNKSTIVEERRWYI